ncbi:MAG: hypothetical protein AMJ53_15600, partial [Gammaproteobacteria bacterium SG8_11]
WNISNEHGDFSLSMDEDGINDVLTLSHIETPTGVGTVKDGKLADVINQQQIKTYALFPSQLSYTPDTSGVAASTPTTAVSPPTATVGPGSAAAPTLEMATETPLAKSTPAVESEQRGKGCLFGLFSIL